MIAFAADAAADSTTWQRVVISVLVVLAFALASWGLLHAFAATTTIARRMESARSTRDRLRMELRAEQERIKSLDIGHEERNALTTAAQDRWRQGHHEAGIEPWTYRMVDDGREPVAEELVRELSATTRTDLWIAGAGLLLGLIASVWGTWI